MAKDTQPIFIVGSGRSGTRLLFRLLSGIPNMEVYHEYCCTHVQPLSCLYFMKKITRKELMKELSSIYKSALHFSNAKYLVDSSNKLSWVIPELYELFPSMRIINLVRDGRKVTSSFFHKLNSEIYDDKSVDALNSWIHKPNQVPMPPPEKKYWWNIPQKKQLFHKEFSSFDQFQRIAYHWSEVYRVIGESLRNIPAKQQMTVKLEDLISNKKYLQELFEFIEIDFDQRYFELIKKPQGVIFPMDFKLTAHQQKQFNAIARKQMRKLGYVSKKEYRVSY